MLTHLVDDDPSLVRHLIVLSHRDVNRTISSGALIHCNALHTCRKILRQVPELVGFTAFLQAFAR